MEKPKLASTRENHPRATTPGDEPIFVEKVNISIMRI